MSCTSKANTKSFLINRGVIDKYYNILDLPRFRAYVTDLSNYSKKYGIDQRLYFEEGNKAIPNTEAFQIIDKKKGITYPENEWVDTDLTKKIDLVKEYKQTILSLEDYLIKNQIITKIC